MRLYHRALFGAIWLALAGLVIVPRIFAGGTWVPLTNTAPGPVGDMLLLTDGSVMAFNNKISNSCYRLTPDIHGSYANGTWQTLAPMHDSRLYMSSDVLKDGRLFVAGGEYGIGTRTGEVYDPICNFWLMAPPSGQSFEDSISQVVANGNVLIAPVVPNPSGYTIFFNIVSNVWNAGPKLVRGSDEDEASWVLLPDQSVITIDSFGTNSERYIPALSAWINDATVPDQLYDSDGEMGAGVMLPDGRAFFLGATGHTAFYTPSGTTNPGTWVAGPDIPNSQGTPDASAAMMVNGKLLCAVSPLGTGNEYPSPTSFYEFDYTSNTFTQISAPTGTTENVPSYYTTMLDLPDGSVLCAHFSSQLYEYQPGGSPLVAGKPVISSIVQNADSTFLLTGTGLNGISAGAVYGDDWQMNGNYPIIRLTDASNDVYYARTSKFTNAVMTGSAPVSTEFTLPTNLPPGTFSLAVVANGISSDPVTFIAAPIRVLLPASAIEGSAPITGTVTLPSASTSGVVINLTSSLPARATVQSSVTIPAGQTSAQFTVTIIDDSLLNGSQAAMISAAASGYQGGLAYLVVQDNESAVLGVSANLNFTGSAGGPFTSSNPVFTLTNSGNYPLNWAATDVPYWINLSATGGTLAAGATTNITGTINSSAGSFTAGSYSGSIIFDNATSGNGDTTRSVSLTISTVPTLAISKVGTNVVISWSTNNANFTVQYTGNPKGGTWHSMIPAPAVVNGQYTLTNAITGSQMFFRLVQ